MARDGLGELEHQVMLTVLRLGEDAYSAPIVDELERRTGRVIALSSVYIVLRRLEDKGCAASRMEPVSGARDRRVFSITAKGLERLREQKRAYQQLWDGLDAVLEGQV